MVHPHDTRYTRYQRRTWNESGYRHSLPDLSSNQEKHLRRLFSWTAGKEGRYCDYKCLAFALFSERSICFCCYSRYRWASGHSSSDEGGCSLQDFAKVRARDKPACSHTVRPGRRGLAILPARVERTHQHSRPLLPGCDSMALVFANPERPNDLQTSA